MSERTHRFSGQRWSLAVFASGDDPGPLTNAVLAAANADRAGASLTIDVLVIDDAALGPEMSARLAAGHWWAHGTTVRLWSVPSSDKASAWNQYLQALMPVADVAFFLDGAVQLERDALALMVDALHERPQALAATSLPAAEASEAELRRRLPEGGIHGAFYALTAAAIRRLREIRFQLPVGLARGDSALGASLAFNLDPATHGWNWDRIALVPEVDYRTPASQAVHGHPRRSMEQSLLAAQGRLESRALKDHLVQAKRAPSAWPATARELVLQWADANAAEARALMWGDPLAWAALVQLRGRSAALPVAGSAQCLGRYVRTAGAPAPALSLTEH